MTAQERIEQLRQQIAAAQTEIAQIEAGLPPPSAQTKEERFAEFDRAIAAQQRASAIASSIEAKVKDAVLAEVSGQRRARKEPAT